MDYPIGWRRTAVITLAFAAVVLSYMDRQVIALLKPTLEQQFGWSDGDYSAMASAFQFSAAIAFHNQHIFSDIRSGSPIGSTCNTSTGCRLRSAEDDIFRWMDSCGAN